MINLPGLSSPLVVLVTPVGPRVTCNPAPTDTDADFLVLLDAGAGEAFEASLLAAGWGQDGSKPENSEIQMSLGFWWSYSLTIEGVRQNIIATVDEGWHARFLLATDTAKTLNLLSKADRITLFQAILYGVRA